MSLTKAYNAWVSMRQRCNNKKHPEYFRYGEVGITVDERWDDFNNFIKDVGVPESSLSLDRIDPKGNYTPSNCRWATKAQQSYNQKMKKTNTSGKSGVKEYKGSRWRAFIGFNGKQHHLGYFDTYEEALQARQKAELDFYGYMKE